jgi:hypothetical protein
LVKHLVELAGVEPATSSMPRKRAPTAPQPPVMLPTFYRRFPSSQVIWHLEYT